jgi:anti-anti-sigma factor
MYLIHDHPSHGVIDPAAGPEFVDIHVAEVDHNAIITVTGELDVSNTAWLFDCLHDSIDAGFTQITVDVEQLSYLDSAGLAVLLGAHKRMEGAGSTLTLFAPMPSVARLLEVTGLASQLNIQSAEGWGSHS